VPGLTWLHTDGWVSFKIDPCFLSKHEIGKNISRKFKVCKSVHHRTIQIDHQPDATISSTTVRTEYFKHAAHSPFFTSKCRLFHNANFFDSCIIHILHTECVKI
jgi:pterin-4a-carbinolamine dehydratase